MNTKLTLKMDSATIEEAKSFARANQTSLSKLVETYFKALTRDPAFSKTIPGVVGELAGILKERDVGSVKKEYTDDLEAKYR